MDKIVFYDQSGSVKENLYDSIAQEIAKSFCYEDRRNGLEGGVSHSQIRKIFDEVKRFKRIIELDSDGNAIFKEILPEIKMIKAKSKYAVERQKKEIKFEAKKKSIDSFFSFIEICINQIITKKDFNTFCLLFEAVYAFYYPLSDKK